MKISLICAALPPRFDGIGDYTALLAAELGKSHVVNVLTSEANALPIPNVKIDVCYSTNDAKSYWKILDQVQADKPDWVVLQYNPFCYGLRGKNLQLPRVMQSIKKRCVGTRFALMVHEPFMPITCWKTAIMTTWQRWQLWSLGNTADVLFFSIQSWTNKFQRWFPSKKAVHLPVGSNIPFTGTSRADARANLSIGDDTTVVGFFGQAHQSRMFDCMQQAAMALHEQGKKILVLCVGTGGDKVRSAFGDLPVKITGPLSAEDVSRHLAAIDIYLSAFDDGISTRRGSMMAGIQHGLPIAATNGRLTDDILLKEKDSAFLLSRAGDQKEFNESVVKLGSDTAVSLTLGINARRLYEKEFAWNRISDKLITVLDQT